MCIGAVTADACPTRQWPTLPYLSMQTVGLDDGLTIHATMTKDEMTPDDYLPYML